MGNLDGPGFSSLWVFALPVGGAIEADLLLVWPSNNERRASALIGRRVHDLCRLSGILLRPFNPTKCSRIDAGRARVSSFSGLLLNLNLRLVQLRGEAAHLRSTNDVASRPLLFPPSVRLDEIPARHFDVHRTIYGWDVLIWYDSFFVEADPCLIGGVNTMTGLAFFLPTIVNELGYSATRTQLISVGPYAAGFVGSFTLSACFNHFYS